MRRCEIFRIQGKYSLIQGFMHSGKKWVDSPYKAMNRVALPVFSQGAFFFLSFLRRDRMNRRQRKAGQVLRARIHVKAA